MSSVGDTGGEHRAGSFDVTGIWGSEYFRFKDGCVLLGQIGVAMRVGPEIASKANTIVGQITKKIERRDRREIYKTGQGTSTLNKNERNVHQWFAVGNNFLFQ